jgi:hypothetical protein
MPERDTGASVASPTLGGPAAASTEVSLFRKGKNMNLEPVSQLEMQAIDGGTVKVDHALQGAVAGAVVGASVGGGVGAAIGAAVGFVVGLFT